MAGHGGKNGSMGLAIFLLGKPRVERNGMIAPAPRGQKVWALLGYMLRNGPNVSRRRVCELLFADAEDPQAALRWNLSELRKLLGISGLQGDMLDLSDDPYMVVDVHTLTKGTWSQALRVMDFDRTFLEGLQLTGCASFEVWLETERRNVRATAEAVLREAALARLASGKSTEACDLASRLVQHNPLNEDYQVLLVRCLAAAGDGVGAARQASACRELFMRELGQQPGRALDTALATTTAMPTGRALSGRVGALAQLEAGEAAISAGVLEAGLHCLRRSVMEADGTGDPELRCRTRVALGGALVHAARGRDEEGATALHEALVLGRNACPSCAAAASRELGYIEFLRGRYERALVLLQDAAKLAGNDLAENARIATVQGSILSDTAHYSDAIATFKRALRHSEQVQDHKQLAYVLSMLGRAQLLRGDIELAKANLDHSISMAQRLWTAFLPWPLSLRAELDLHNGDLGRAGERFEHAFALGCQLSDPCWEGISGRGRGCVAAALGDEQRAIDILLDALDRCARLPDGYLWAEAHTLDALSAIAVRLKLPRAGEWIGKLQSIAARSGMRELTARALAHRGGLGDASSTAAATLLGEEIDSPLLWDVIAEYRSVDIRE